MNQLEIFISPLKYPSRIILYMIHYTLNLSNKSVKLEKLAVPPTKIKIYASIKMKIKWTLNIQTLHC